MLTGYNSFMVVLVNLLSQDTKSSCMGFPGAYLESFNSTISLFCVL